MQTTPDNDQLHIKNAPTKSVLATFVESLVPEQSNTHQVTTIARPWQPSFGWILFALLLLLEYALFRQFALREITWAYPTNFDQITYLSLSYEIYEHILTYGLRQGFLHGLSISIPNGIMLHLQASVLYLLIGPSRLSALTLNFIYFALFQSVLAWTLRWLTDRWSIALLGVGLLLTATAPFFWYTMMDFRIDAIAFCLFGIFICLVIRSKIFLSRRWSLIIGAVAALLTLFRFLVIAYMVGIFGLVFVFFCVRLWRQRHSDRAQRRHITRQLYGLVLAILVLIGLTTPALWHSREVLLRYYAGHVTSSESQFRPQEMGIFNLTDALLYYPKSLLRVYTGPIFLILSTLALTIAAVLARVRPDHTQQQAVVPAQEIQGAYFFISVCLVVPLGILTMDPSKSPIAGNIMAPPLLWLILLTIIVLTKTYIPESRSTLVAYTVAGMALIIFCIGGVMQLNSSGKRTELSLQRTDVEQLSQLYDLVGQTSLQMGWKTPRISSDSISDYLYPGILKPLFYERQGIILDAQAELGGISIGLPEISKADAITLLKNSDFAIMTTNLLTKEQLLYPFNRSMQTLRPELISFCNQNFVQLQRFHFFDRDVILYIRPSLGIRGDSGGWITSSGIILTGSGSILNDRPVVELHGKTHFNYLSKLPNIHAQLLMPNQDPKDILASLTTSGEDYRIRLELGAHDVQTNTPVQISLLFDTYFVPKDIGLNEDTRQLVIETPTEVTLLRQQ